MTNYKEEDAFKKASDFKVGDRVIDYDYRTVEFREGVVIIINKDTICYDSEDTHFFSHFKCCRKLTPKQPRELWWNGDLEEAATYSVFRERPTHLKNPVLFREVLNLCSHTNTKTWEPHLAGAKKCLDCHMVINPIMSNGWHMESDE